MLVTAGGLAPDDDSWVNPKHPRFLVPDPALSEIFRAKFCAGLKKAGLLRFVPASVWKIRRCPRIAAKHALPALPYRNSRPPGNLIPSPEPIPMTFSSFHLRIWFVHSTTLDDCASVCPSRDYDHLFLLHPPQNFPRFPQ